jgi:hypothetical protein
MRTCGVWLGITIVVCALGACAGQGNGGIRCEIEAAPTLVARMPCDCPPAGRTMKVAAMIDLLPDTQEDRGRAQYACELPDVEVCETDQGGKAGTLACTSRRIRQGHATILGQCIADATRAKTKVKAVCTD